MRWQQMLPALLTLLLLLLLEGGGMCDELHSEHECPPRSMSRSKCRSDGLQSEVVTHYEWNPYLKRCQKKIQLNEVACDRTSSKKGICPEPRTVEPGPCNRRKNQQKTLVMHYEPDGKGGCVLHKDFTYPTCPEKKPGSKDDSGGCPEARYYQKPCSGRHRQVFKFYYVRGKSGKGDGSLSRDCIEKTSITIEACGAFVPAKRCPSPKVSERGICKDGFRTLIRTEYSRDPAGKCVASSHKVAQTCDGSEALEPCPPNVVKQGPCVNGLRHVTRQYYERTKRTGIKCIRKFSVENLPCGKYKSGVCPKPRVLEPGPCIDGRTRVLVAHYEPDPRTSRCREQRSFTVKTCGKSKSSASGGHGTTSDSVGGRGSAGSGGGGDSSRKVAGRTGDCPEKAYSQGPCKKGYRNLFTFTYRYSVDLKRCMKHVALKREQCAALVTTESCPADDTVESGPCIRGFRTNILYHYKRNAEGQCRKKVRKVTSPCVSKNAGCPPKQEKKMGNCEDNIQRYTTVYYEYSKLKKRCIRKFRAKEKPCKGEQTGAEGGSSGPKKKACPKRRVIEPGPCKNGEHKLLIEHYEYSEKLERCVRHQDFVTQKCGKKAAQKKPTPGIDLNHECPEKTVTQSACRAEGYRTVTTVYFVFVKALGRCVRKVKQEDEKCALLVKNSNCPADVTQETGPCTNGYRTNIVYTYKRDIEGRCERQSKKITVSCNGTKTNACPPKRVKKVGKCKDRIQRWLTVYFEFSKLKGRCVRKFRAREKPCGGAKGGLGSTGATKSKKCPKRRVMEPGPCKDGARKVLVEHYEYSEKLGRCVAHKDFVTQKCGKKAAQKKPTPGIDLNHECPEKTVTQSACRAEGYRTVTTVYFVFVKALGRCVRKVKQEDEKCALLVKNSNCPADVTQETGPCTNGYRTNIVYTYKRDIEGRCERQSKKITVSCNGTKTNACPPKRVKKVGKCKDRIQRWLTVYFEFSKLKGRCVRKFRAREKPCGGAKGGLGSTGAAKSKKCPKRRVMEPGPCKDGARKVLVEHYEYSEKLGRCVAHKDFVTQKCGKKAAQKKPTPGIDLNHECPEKTVTQSACRAEGYRTVTTVYFVFVRALGRCVRKVKQEDEKCALLVKLARCPKDSVVEAGPCTSGFRTNIIYRFTRDLDGRCVRNQKSIIEPCVSKSSGCKPISRKLLKPCSASGFERWLTTYYVYNRLKERCVRKLRYKELSCRRVKKCPTPRVIEPSPCRNGKQRVLIEHYELDAKHGRCRMRRDYVHRICGKPTKRQAEAAKHHCPNSVYHQKACKKDGYRSVVKIYYRFNAAKGRCVRNVRVDNEKCSRLVGMRTTCEADQMVEEGPCIRGFRQDIIYRYERRKDGSCHRKEQRVTLTCVSKKVAP